MYASLPRTKHLRSLLGTPSLLLLALACSDDEARVIDMETGAEQPSNNGGSSTTGSSNDVNDSRPGMSSAGTSANGTPALNSGGTSSGSAGSGGNDMMLPPPGGDVAVSGEISADTTWTAGNVYLLQDQVFVVGDSTLTIEPGTVIRGEGLGAALIVTRGSRLVANGTKEAPIVFTSGLPAGERRAGQWGGVVLLGGAPINGAAGIIEGIAPTDLRAQYGGPVAGMGDPAHDCGSLQYVRIEFAGFQYSADNELNSLTLGGCGSATRIDHVQVHRGLDDGIEVFGGTVDIKHAVITAHADDGLDWDRGWQGRAQFIVVRTDPSASDGAIEADSLQADPDAAPRSNPTMYNLTLIGDQGSLASPGVVLRRGTWATIRDSIVMGFPVSGLDIRDAASIGGANAEGLTVANSIFFQNGPDGTLHADVANDGTNVADGLDEGPWLEARSNQLGVDPALAAAYDQTAPSFVPSPGATTAPGAFAGAPMTDFFVPAPYVGALPPAGAGEDWTEGWTSYPAN